MRKSLAGLIFIGVIMIGCASHEKNIFREEIGDNSSIDGAFTVSVRDLYSVSIENRVESSSKENRKKAWAYLNWVNSKESLSASVRIYKIDDAQVSLVLEEVVKNPKINSWSADKLYIELARAELNEGKYRISASISGKSLNHDSFISYMIIEHTYTGK